jgi:glycosyltransferase involved in cell wall biosynthesis
MRIIHAVGWYFPETLGGTEVYVAGLARRLRAAGHEILIAAPDARHGRERIYEHEGIPVYRYPVPADPTRAECQGLVPARGAQHLHAWLASQRPDVVHFHSFVTGLGLAEVKAAKATRARIVVTTHSSRLGFICQRGTMMRWGERLCDGVSEPAKCAACELQHRGLPKLLAGPVGALPPALGRIARSLPGRCGTALAMSDLIARNRSTQREMLALVDRFVVLTRWALDAVVANGAPAGKLVLNPLGFGQTAIQRKPGPREQPTMSPVKVGYLGRFESLKGVADLARAAASLPGDLAISVEFRGPANAAEPRCLEETRAWVERDSRMRFAPAVPWSEAGRALAGYDVLCCPSRCLEGGPTVAIEAHAAGTPVIGTRVGGLAELVTDGVNGRLAEPGNWRELAGILAELAREPARTVDRWRAALPPARTMDDVAADYLAVYAA